MMLIEVLGYYYHRAMREYHRSGRGWQNGHFYHHHQKMKRYSAKLAIRTSKTDRPVHAAAAG